MKTTIKISEETAKLLNDFQKLIESYFAILDNPCVPNDFETTSLTKGWNVVYDAVLPVLGRFIIDDYEVFNHRDNR